MQPLRDAAKGVRFVAGHPFAGLERSGLRAGSAGLFLRRTWFVDRQDKTVQAMVTDAGARHVVIDAADHDRSMALGSHLPQVVSTALASLLAGIDPLFVGTGAQSVLRLAGARVDTIRGPALGQYVLAVARDGYRVAFSLGELAPALGNARVMVVTREDGKPLADRDGPWRLWVPGDQRPSR